MNIKTMIILEGDENTMLDILANITVKEKVRLCKYEVLYANKVEPERRVPGSFE